MIFRIEDDVVERRLDLIGRRTILQAVVQFVVALAIVAFLTMVFGGTISNMVAKLPANWIGRFDCWWRLILAASIICVPATLIGAFALRLVFMFSDGCTRLTWDARTGELQAIIRGGLWGKSRRVNIPLSEIHRIDLHAAPGGQMLTLKMTIRSAKQSQREPLEAELRVRHVDRREEALDLIFRIARQCGIAYYAIETSDVRNLKVRVVRSPKDKDKHQPVPEGSSSVRYEENQVSPGVELPPLRVGTFSSSVFANTVQGTQLKEWQPGKRIHFYEPAADAAMHAVAALVTAVGAGFIAYQVAPLFAAWLPGWATMTLAIVVAPLVTCTIVFFAFREREIVLDWPTDTVGWRVGRRWRHAPLGQVEKLVLRGFKKTVSQKKRRSYSKYWCRLEMCVQGRRVLIAQSNEYKEDPDTPANRLGSLAAALAESLSIGWDWRDYDCWT